MLVFILCVVCGSTPFQKLTAFPSELRLFTGQSKQLELAIPVSSSISVKNPSMIRVNGESRASFKLNPNEPISLLSTQSGATEMDVKLFGTIPFRKVKVQVVPDLKVIPGGQTIGVKIKSAGIMVVGHHLVTVADNKKISPGEQADIHVGDLIVRINGRTINDVTKVADIVKEAAADKKPLLLDIVRGSQKLKIEVHPAFDSVDKAYRLGLYIRDSAAGVGTLTFYVPGQSVYGALGHVITDLDTQTPIPVGSGEILHSSVTSISKSQSGEPGEKRAQFFRENKVLGNIERNTPFGIFGRMTAIPNPSYFKEPVPVAFAEEVKEGPAEIYTVINGQEVEKFNIQVIHVTRQNSPATKGMVIKITDPRLLEKTGGIVQGMSGSPILQNGKLIGAVTHVFVNDPTSGYGCFIEWMLQDAGIKLQPQKGLKAS